MPIEHSKPNTTRCSSYDFYDVHTYCNKRIFSDGFRRSHRSHRSHCLVTFRGAFVEKSGKLVINLCMIFVFVFSFFLSNSVEWTVGLIGRVGNAVFVGVAAA